MKRCKQEHELFKPAYERIRHCLGDSVTPPGHSDINARHEPKWNRFAAESAKPFTFVVMITAKDLLYDAVGGPRLPGRTNPVPRSRV